MSPLRYIIVCLLLCMPAMLDAARILALMSLPLYSHQSFYRPLWIELAKKHEIVLLTSHPMNISHPNLRQLDMSHAIKIFEGYLPRLVNGGASFSVMNIYMKSIHDVLDYELGHDDVQTLLRNESEHFDVVMTENATPALLQFAVHFNCPGIVVSSTNVPDFVYYILNEPVSYLYSSSDKGQLLDTFNLYEHYRNYLQYIFLKIWIRIVLIPMQVGLLAKHTNYTVDMYSDEFRKKAALCFININPVFVEQRPLSATVVNLAGGMHIMDEQPLPQDLKQFIDESVNGVIYVSFGSSITSNHLPNKTFALMLRTFSEMSENIIWKYDGDFDAFDKPKNVFVKKWVPQHDLLRHKNVRAFVTQCGTQSIDEALVFHVPMVCLPFVGDQFKYATRVQHYGLGINLYYPTMTYHTFKTALVQVIRNETYRENAAHLAKLINDKPMSHLEQAVWWTEYVIRNPDTSIFRPPEVSIFHYYYLDLLSIIIIVVIIVVVYVKLTIDFLIWILSDRARKHKRH